MKICLPTSWKIHSMLFYNLKRFALNQILRVDKATTLRCYQLNKTCSSTNPSCIICNCYKSFGCVSKRTSLAKWVGNIMFLVLSGFKCFLKTAAQWSWSDLGFCCMNSIHSCSLQSFTNWKGRSPRKFFAHKFPPAWTSLLIHNAWLCLAAKCNGVSLYEVPWAKDIVFAFGSAPYLATRQIFHVNFVFKQKILFCPLSWGLTASSFVTAKHHS